MAGKITTLFEDSERTKELYPRTKTSAVYDEYGHPLGDLAVYDAVTIESSEFTPYEMDMIYYETVAEGVDAVNVGLDMDLLWENSSPTASFGAQTITINLNAYSSLLVTYLVLSGNTSYAEFIISLKDVDIEQASLIYQAMRYRTVS